MSPEYFFDSLISLTTICFHGDGLGQMGIYSAHMGSPAFLGVS